jgi:hypothetical protein
LAKTWLQIESLARHGALTGSQSAKSERPLSLTLQIPLALHPNPGGHATLALHSWRHGTLAGLAFGFSHANPAGQATPRPQVGG